MTIPANIADVTDLAALSAALGPATEAEARALAPSKSDAALIKLGNTVATPRIDADALRLLRSAASFFATAPAASRARVNLSPDFIRVAAWSALQGHEAWTAIATRTAAAGTTDATRATQSMERLAHARALRDQLAEVVAQVGGTSAWQVKVTAAVRPGATGMPEARADVALAALAALGRTLLASKSPDVRQRAALYALGPAQLDEAEKVAAATAAVAGRAKSPRSVAKRATVDRWDGLNLTILERVTRAFGRASAVDATIPALDFVSLRSRTNAKGKGDPAAPAAPTPSPGKKPTTSGNGLAPSGNDA
ncbi:MAG: hypothetical protein Q7V43_14155 [Myxococcales bacterium]|nr:hypothetical protein [Myxococcales bacterium]